MKYNIITIFIQVNKTCIYVDESKSEVVKSVSTYKPFFSVKCDVCKRNKNYYTLPFFIPKLTFLSIHKFWQAINK